MLGSALDTQLDILLLKDFTIPCSGTGHWPGPDFDPRLHGNDPSKPAEWYVHYQCAYCPHSGMRPVCDFFAQQVRTDETRVVACGQCGKSNFTIDFFWVGERI